MIAGNGLLWLGTLWALVHQANSLSMCNKIDVCKCQSDEGLVDLTPLDSKGTPSFDGIRDPSSGYTYSYNPCTPYNQNACSGVAVCQYSSSFSYPAGKHVGNVFTVEGGHLVITYKATDSTGTTRTAKIALICNQQEHGKLVSLGESSLIYQFQLTSKYACPSGGGGGPTTAPVTVTTAPPTHRPPTPAPAPNCDQWFYVVIFLVFIIVLLIACLVLVLVKGIGKVQSVYQRFYDGDNKTKT